MNNELSIPERQHRSTREKFWQAHMDAQQKSGLTQAEYCRRTNLNKHTFNWWRKKSRKEKRTTVDLVPVSIVSPWSRQRCRSGEFAGLSIVTHTGHRVEVHENFHPAVLDRLLQVLGGL